MSYLRRIAIEIPWSSRNYHVLRLLCRRREPSYELIRQDIVEGRLSAGYRLNVSELGRSLRPAPIRCARPCSNCAGRGLRSSSGRNRGARDPPIVDDFVRDVYEVTALLEAVYDTLVPSTTRPTTDIVRLESTPGRDRGDGHRRVATPTACVTSASIASCTTAPTIATPPIYGGGIGEFLARHRRRVPFAHARRQAIHARASRADRLREAAGLRGRRPRHRAARRGFGAPT